MDPNVDVRQCSPGPGQCGSVSQLMSVWLSLASQRKYQNTINIYLCMGWLDGMGSISEHYYHQSTANQSGANKDKRTKGECGTTYQPCCPFYTTIHRTTEKTQLHQITSNVTPAPALANAKLKNIQNLMMTMIISRFTKKICLVQLHRSEGCLKPIEEETWTQRSFTV